MLCYVPRLSLFYVHEFIYIGVLVLETADKVSATTASVFLYF